MIRRVAIAAISVLAVSTALAQSSSPVAAPTSSPRVLQKESLAGKSGISTSPSANVPPSPVTLADRVKEMEGTLAKMHVVLRQMRMKAGSSPRDPLAKANIDMWELMVSHLENQLKELHIAMAVRDDMESRRAALYKQADAKAEAQAQAARRLAAAKAATPANGATESGSSNPPAAGAASNPPASVPGPPNSGSPN